MTQFSNSYESIIGLEIHVQLKTASKMFCASPNNPDAAEPNVNICEVCTGQPGSLPVANGEAIRKAVIVGLALHCEIPAYSKFDRKNYFYPDLPKGYQISQYDQPLAMKGWVEIGATISPPQEEGKGEVLEPTTTPSSSPSRGGEKKKIRITRAHLEEDAGKLIHEGGVTLVDLNRAGVPLLEVVTEPDFRSPLEAKAFLQNLRNVVRYLGVSDADMEKGHLRCDANVSIRKLQVKELPSYKVEVKNLNSFKAVEAALAYEIERQVKVLDAGEKLVNETRGWDEVKQATAEQRTKEEAQDYRYFPEPDLPILHFTREYVEELRAQIPELPEAKLRRFQSEFGLPLSDAEVLTGDKNLAGYFEEVVSELEEWIKELPPSPSLAKEGEKGGVNKFAKLAANWLTGDLQALLKKANINPQDAKVTAENLAELIKMIDRGEISVTAGKKVLGIMFEKGGDPSNIAVDEGLGQISDEASVAAVVEKVIAENPQAVYDWRAGKKQAHGFLVGKIMAAMRGQGNPQIISQLLSEKLK